VHLIFTMAKIDPKQWRPLFDAVYKMNPARDQADFATAVLAALRRLIPADYSHLHSIDRGVRPPRKCQKPPPCFTGRTGGI
jgi:hypothetical protein